MTFSIYTSAFNVVKNNFKYEKVLENFCAFADEVVVAVNTSEDNSLEVMRALAKKHLNLRVIATDIPYGISIDGAIKDAALQTCTSDILIQMDLDEYIPLSQKPQWISYAQWLIDQPDVDCFLIPTIDVWGDIKKVRANENVGIKFRMHKRGLRRGIWEPALRGDKIDTSRSDSTELLDADGNLARAVHIVHPSWLRPESIENLNNTIYTVHEGYLDFGQRVKLNKAFWSAHWSFMAGSKQDIVEEESKLDNVPTIEHKLKLN